MAWQPIYTNTGLFNDTPSGNLTVPFDNARQIGNFWTDGPALFCNYGNSEDDNPYLRWANARGKSFSDKLIGILNNNHGSSATDVIFAAITSKNPEGAQFYKQELIVYGTWLSDNIVHTTNPSDPFDQLDYYYAEVFALKIARRVWATPYSTPTVTDLHVSNVGGNMFIAIQGNRRLEPLYSFLDKGLFCLGDVHYNNKYYYGVGFYFDESRTFYSSDAGQYVTSHSNKFGGVAFEYDWLDEQFGGSFEPEATDDPNEEPDEPGGGESGEGGGDGDHEGKYDPIPIPPTPTIAPHSAGFVYMLRMGVATMQIFAQELLDPSWWAAIKAFFADPMDFICGVMIVPFTPDSNRDVIPKFGQNYMSHAFPEVTNQYKVIDCGDLYISKYYDSCFDNNPYTSIKIWLPYIGYRELDVDEVMGKTVHIEYHCDCMTGDCICFIQSKGAGNGSYVERVIAQFSGNCGVRVPFGSQSFDAAVAASIQLLGGAVGMAAGGIAAPAGLAAGAIGESQIASSVAGCTMAAVASNKVSTERSGTAGASAGYLSIQYPYILKEVPRQSRPGNYKELEGYPSNIKGPLTNFSGFVALETINLNGIQATREELNEIDSLMRSGVFI